MLPKHSIHSTVIWTLFAGTTLLAQQRADLPPPKSSRAPLLTTMTSDSIRHHTAHLHVGELLQALQAGDATTGSALLRNAALGFATCGGVAEAFSKANARVRKIARSDGGTSLALFFEKIAIADSGATQVVTADLLVVTQTSNVPTRSSVRLDLDAERAVWTAESGLMKALCSL